MSLSMTHELPIFLINTHLKMTEKLLTVTLNHKRLNVVFIEKFNFSSYFAFGLCVHVRSVLGGGSIWNPQSLFLEQKGLFMSL